ncbi:MAG: iron-containing alcohol dehydrogenase [Candidatus Aenigmarchaeota archaeon]|nr:iron-containing alcohol dehydrogenase [Candidatus Aenigmarchaeota archaeon]
MLIAMPYKILVDKNVKGRISSTIESTKAGKSCSILCSKNLHSVAKQAINEISSSFDVELIDPISSEKNYIKNIADRSKTDFFVGIGGGKTIDIAKYAAHASEKPWVAFPTILSHDGVVSSRAVLEDNGSKISVDAREPVAIIADLSIIKKSDYKYLSAGLGDLISNFSAVEDWKIADKAGKEKYHEIIGRLSLISAEAVTAHIPEIRKKDYHGLEILFWSLVSAGFAMNLYGSSRPCSGSEHNISHALDHKDSTSLHGQQVALATIISTYLQKGDWQKIRNLLVQASLPITAKDLGIEKNKIIEALVDARNIRKRYTILNKLNLTKTSAEKVLKKVKVI